MFRPPLTPEVSSALQTVYGEHGLAVCEEFSYREPELAEPELLATYRTDPCSQETRFFRHRLTMDELTSYVAPELVRDVVDGTLRIAQIGCTGEETWSLATMLNMANLNPNTMREPVPYRISAYNINQRTLDQMYGPFPTTIEDMSHQSGDRIGPATLRRNFEEIPEGVRPRDVLTANVVCARHDILEAAVPGSVVGAVAVFNVLWHYPPETRGHIMANMLEKLRPDGAFLFEGLTRDSMQAPDYREWVKQLHEYGLRRRREQSLTDLLMYRPDTARKTFEKSAAVEDALGILSAAQQGV